SSRSKRHQQAPAGSISRPSSKKNSAVGGHERPPTRANTRRVAAGIMVQRRYDRSQTPREGPGSSGDRGDRIGTPNAQNNRRVDITPPRRLNIEASPSGWKAGLLKTSIQHYAATA